MLLLHLYYFSLSAKSHWYCYYYPLLLLSVPLSVLLAAILATSAVGCLPITDGFYETTASATTVTLDTRRLAVTSDAIAANIGSTPNRQQVAPSK